VSIRRGFFGRKGFRTRSDARMNMYVGVILGALTGYFIFYDLILLEVGDYDVPGEGMGGESGSGSAVAGAGAGAGAGDSGKKGQ